MDLWDFVGVSGAASLLAGVACVYWPAALILGGAVLLGLYYLRERHVPPSPDRERTGN